jgi:predicted metal-binding protein
MHLFVALAQNHFDHTKEISTADITLDESVRRMCEQNKCGQYGKNWTCPPAVQSVEAFRQEISSYNTFLIVYQVYAVKSSFDWRGMMAGGKDFAGRLHALKKQMDAAGSGIDFRILGAGGCRLCERCAYLDEEPCRFPLDALVSMEACGIDVMALMKDNGLKYYNGKNTVTFIGGILYNGV